MINSEPIPIMNQMLSNRMPQTYQPYTQPQSPNTTRLTLEQQYQDISNKMMNNPHNLNQNTLNQQQSDPYSDYVSVLQSCTDITRGKIIQDERYVQIYSQCDEALKQYLYAQVLPIVVESPQGRVLFEQLHTTTKALKDEYTQLDLQREQNAIELEKRLAEREKSLAEKERQLEEILSKTQVQDHSPTPSGKNQNQNYKNKQYQNGKEQSGGLNE